MRAAALVLALACTAEPGQEREAEARRPNLVLAIADDLDPGHLGFLGNPLARTPRLDRLAQQGWLTPVLYAQPVCRAALGVLLSGRWPHETGVTSNGAEAALPTASVLPARLRAAGYASFCAGKFWEGPPPDYGFDAPAVNDERFARTGEDGQAELFRFLEERSARGPWFVWWAPSLPHTPHRPPVRFAQDFATTELAPPPEFRGSAEDFQAAERASLAMHEWMDAELRRLLAKLEELGELEETVILFLADNGWSTWRVSKGTPREQGVCMPLIASAPGQVRRGLDAGFLADLVDVHATLLDYAGAAPAPEDRGRSLRPYLEGRAESGRARLFGSAHARRGELYALYARDRRWKYVRYVRDVNSQELSPGPRLAEPFRRKSGVEELYDLAADPFELENLARREEHAERLAELRAATLDWWRETGGPELPEGR